MDGSVSRGMRLAVLAVVLAGASDAAVRASLQDAPVSQAPVTIEQLLESAAAYVERFEEAFSNAVAEERYEQRVTPRSVGTEAQLVNPAAPGIRARELVSDFLLVKLPETVGWIPFRDVFEVDGNPVRDRDDRLIDLLVNPDESTTSRVRSILEASAGYNIGVPRTMNLPTLGLEVLHETVQARFRFSNLRPDRDLGPRVYAIDYQEETMPSMISGPDGRDLLARGELSIDAEDGTVLRTRVWIDDPVFIRVRVETTFRPDPTFGVAMPAVMREEYTEPSRRRTSGTATYTGFRRFGVETTDVFQGLTPGGP